MLKESLKENIKFSRLTCVSSSRNSSWYWWAAQQQSFLWKHQTWARNPESHKRWLFEPVRTLLRNTATAAATRKWFSEMHKFKFICHGNILVNYLVIQCSILNVHIKVRKNFVYLFLFFFFVNNIYSDKEARFAPKLTMARSQLLVHNFLNIYMPCSLILLLFFVKV